MLDFTRKTRSYRKRDIKELVSRAGPLESPLQPRALRSWQPPSAACPFPLCSPAGERWAKANPETARMIPYFRVQFFVSEEST